MQPIYGISDTVWIAIATTLPPTIAAMGTLVAVIIAGVRSTTSFRRARDWAQATHRLVNGAAGLQLQLIANLTRRLAEAPNATEGDKQAAEAAAKAYEEHQRQLHHEEMGGSLPPPPRPLSRWPHP